MTTPSVEATPKSLGIEPIVAPSLFRRKPYRPVEAAQFLPTTRKEMDALGWDACDVVLVTGDAYVDHPSFGMALIGRLLESQGFRVGILAQPDWSSAEPFRALDEFDVFMDSVTRKTSIALLIRAAREDADRQYIFITPHSVSDIPSASDVKVIKMHPPERDQSIIVASQAH